MDTVIFFLILMERQALEGCKNERVRYQRWKQNECHHIAVLLNSYFSKIFVIDS